MSSSSPSHFVLYHYTPNIGAAGLFAALFSIATLAHIYSVVHFRSWFYVPVIVGGLCELIGYIGRALSHSDPNALPPYIMQSLLLLIAPPFFAATIYMSLGRLIRALNAESLSLIKLRWLTRIFVTGDVVCFFVQAAGGGMQATGNVDKLTTYRNIVVGGLALQVLIFGMFVVVAWTFHVRFSNRASVPSASLPWQRCMFSLYGASACILIRNIVRIVEYAQGNDGYIISHEAFIYIFDAVPMLATVGVMWAVHIGKLLRTHNFGAARISLASMGSKYRTEDAESDVGGEDLMAASKPRV